MMPLTLRADRADALTEVACSEAKHDGKSELLALGAHFRAEENAIAL